MASRLKRAGFIRAAVASAVVALPLFATGSAQAAIAGANPATTGNVPQLQSATYLGDGTSVEVCYNVPLAPVASSNFDSLAGLDGYRSGNFQKPANAQLESGSGKSNCLIASFPQGNTGTQNDLNQYTIFTVYAGAVNAATGGATNLDDSVTLSTANTNNGTTGHTTGPDLNGVAPAPVTSTTPNTMVYTFDQNVANSPAPVASKFFMEDFSGNLCRGNTATVSGATVVVTFLTNAAGNAPYQTACNIANAKRAGVDQGAIVSANDPSSPNSLQSAIPPGQQANPGNTQLPDLIGATLNSGGSSVTYTFDKPVSTSSSNIVERDFEVVLSNGIVLKGDAGSATAGTNNGFSTVTVTFTGLTTGANPSPNNNALGDKQEYAVLADVTNGAVNGPGNNYPTGNDNGNSPGTVFNSPGSAPIGGNPGANGRGFTTGPDAFGATVSKGSGVVTITLDQRVAGYHGGAGAGLTGLYFIDSNGNRTAVQPSSVNPTSEPSSPGPETLTLQFTAAQVATVAAIQIQPCTFTTALANNQAYNQPSTNTFGTGNSTGFNSSGAASGNYVVDACNVAQVLAPVVGSARIHGAKVTKTHAKKKRAKAHSRKHAK